MALKKDKMQKLAKKLITKSFEDFSAPFTLKQSSGTYPDPVTNVTETHTAIRTSYKTEELAAYSGQVGDYKIVAENVIWVVVDVRADNLTATYNGKPINIKSVENRGDSVYVFHASDL